MESLFLPCGVALPWSVNKPLSRLRLFTQATQVVGVDRPRSPDILAGAELGKMVARRRSQSMSTEASFS